MNVSIVVSNSLQEVDTMNSHFLQNIVGEGRKDAMLSVEFFVAMAFFISVVGLMFLAVA
jgi:hypothetical protein